MPEGDTLYKTAAALHHVLAGRRLHSCVSELAAVDDWQLRGRTVERVEARGKNLLIHCAALESAALESAALESAALEPLARGGSEPQHQPVAVWSHMGMTGSWHIYRPGERWQKPSHAAALVLCTDQRVVPCFSPAGLELLGPRGLLRHRVLAQLGPDLLDAQADLDEAAARLHALGEMELGAALLRQSAVAGIGNVYKSELLFAARRDPFVPVASLTQPELRSLLERCRKLMQLNLRIAGPRRTRSHRAGERLWVYERSGRPCRVCGTIIRMRRQGPLARSTYFCPRCQLSGSG